MDSKRALLDWLEQLKASSKITIVEGKKDKQALTDAGVKQVVSLKGPLFCIVEEVSKYTKDVILLTDLDKEGKKLYACLSRDFQSQGVRIDNYFREFLFRNTRLRQIEGLPSYIDSLD